MESLKHECGIALIKLRKPIEYFEKKYGTANYALNKLYLLMQKQQNRGQEGAGLACVNLSAEPGDEFMFRERVEGKNAIADLFQAVGKEMTQPQQSKYLPFTGECYMGHLRYSTTGRSGVTYVHPHLRRDNYRRNTFALCGNFNLTNVDEIFEHLKSQGQHPRRTSDTTILLEQLGYYIDKHNAESELVLKEAMPMWDGGFVICGMTGDGEMFAVRDKWGIRSAFYYIDDEIVVIASERPAIQTVMNVEGSAIKELRAAEAIILRRDGTIHLSEITKPAKEITPCSFERIYFSRGNDKDIYDERKQLGYGIVPSVLKSIDNDLDNTVFSFIPNTAETAFWGMSQCLTEHLDNEKYEAILNLAEVSKDSISQITSRRVRIEKVAVKDIKLRTFISESGQRNELANHVYDITYGSIVAHRDNLVVIDDSIVRGTTLRQSIITILSRLHPKKLVIVSSAPQIRYPDFYGIDMADISDLIAFRAVVALSTEEMLEGVYEKCRLQLESNELGLTNYVRELYDQFSDEEISAEIARQVTPSEVKCPVELIFQSVNSLREICVHNSGDWYFSGNYPTSGGVRMICQSYMNFWENRKSSL